MLEPPDASAMPEGFDRLGRSLPGGLASDQKRHVKKSGGSFATAAAESKCAVR